MENLMYKNWKAENEAKIGMRFGEVKGSGLEHVELPLELSSGSTTTRQSSLVNGGEEAKDAEEEEEEVQQVSERAPTLPSCTTSAPRIRVIPQQRQGLHVPAVEEEGRDKRRTQAPNRLTYEALGKPAKSALAGAALIVGDDEESDYEECAFAFFSPVEMPGEPATLKEALESSDAEEWKKAMECDLKSIEENGTWELVELPEGRKAITSKWLFKIKSDADSNIERYKSRLVAKGYQQKEKVDYKELFASVVKPMTLRTLLAGAAIKGWVVKQMDVTTAFLNGVLEEEIFMAQPEGFDDGSGRVFELIKALYGLKQAPRQCYLKLQGVLEEIGFTPSTADHSLFMLGEGEQRSFMVVYVDDILIFSPSTGLVKEVMLKLQDKFKCKALGDVSFYLGLHIEQDVEKRCMRVHQRKYPEALAANFGQSEGHVATPFPSGFKCVKGPEEESVGEEERRRFHSLVGSLMYAAVNTRTDVAFATGQLARVVQCPNEEQVAAGMRVAKYLGQTPTVGLQYSVAAQRRQKGADGVEPGRLFLTASSDASFASEPEDMTSVGGFICCVAGGPTSWESKKQVDQALSSVESEYMALFRAEPGGAGSEGASSGGVEPEGVESEGAGSGGAEPGGAEPAGVEQRVTASSGDTGAGGAGVTAGAGGTGGVAAAGPGGARTGGTGAGGAGAGGARAVDPGAGGAGGSVRPQPYFVPRLQQVLKVPSSPDQSPPPLQPAFPLPAPSPYTEQTGGLTERREPASRPASPPVPGSGRRVPHPRPPPVPGTHAKAIRPSSVPLHFPLPPLPESSLPAVPDPESDRARAARPTVSPLLATVVTDPSFESTAASALVAELVDFDAACRLNYATALVAESESASPPSFGEVITGPYSSQWQAAMDAEIASGKSTGTYVDEVPPSWANIVDGMWIFRVKRPSGSPPAFKALYVARGFSQRQGVDYF
ncbi:unnamed protein product [Closterium sp. NIES-54]